MIVLIENDNFMSIRYYNKLKFKLNNRFNNIDEEDNYFRELEKIDFNKAIKETDEIYEDMLHVYWSYYYTLTILSFLLLFITLLLYMLNINLLPFFILGLSIGIFIGSRIIDIKLQRIYKSYIIGKYLLKLENN